MMHKFTQWRIEKLRGRSVLARLGHDDTELKFLLGYQYGPVKEALSEPPPALATHAAVPPVPHPGASSYPFQIVSFPPDDGVPTTQGRKGRPSKRRRVA